MENIINLNGINYIEIPAKTNDKIKILWKYHSVMVIT